MVSNTELAVLAYRSYAPSDENDVSRVYSRGSDIVIAFRGTDTPQWQRHGEAVVTRARTGADRTLKQRDGACAPPPGPR